LGVRSAENILVIKSQWDNISNFVKDVKDYICGYTYLWAHKNLRAYRKLTTAIEESIYDLNK